MSQALKIQKNVDDLAREYRSSFKIIEGTSIKTVDSSHPRLNSEVKIDIVLSIIALLVSAVFIWVLHSYLVEQTQEFYESENMAVPTRVQVS